MNWATVQGSKFKVTQSRFTHLIPACTISLRTWSYAYYIPCIVYKKHERSVKVHHSHMAPSSAPCIQLTEVTSRPDMEIATRSMRHGIHSGSRPCASMYA